MRIKVLSYNIHKGFAVGNARFVLAEIREAIEETGADIVLLQEVLGDHSHHRKRFENFPKESQFEYLADRLWKHYAYGKNAVYPAGHHGNAILSRFPIAEWENTDISTNRLEQRGILRARIETPAPLEIFCVHLGLFERGRKAQLERILKLADQSAHGAPAIIGGDFNDWRRRVSGKLNGGAGFTEVFEHLTGSCAKTFPAWLPALALDRIYVRGLQPLGCHVFTGGHWSDLSDHGALFCELEWKI